MELVLISVLTLLASGLTFVSGFGLGTLLTPMLALIYPLPLAVAAGAFVHFANNVFKFFLMARFANWDVVSRFGVPAAFASVAGAWVLTTCHDQPAILYYKFGEHEFSVTTAGLLIGPVIMVFSWLELSKRLERFSIPLRFLPLGGFLSGFFGGLSGNQGALRTVFLMKASLNKEAFIASGVVSAMLVDVVRLLVYEAFLMPSQPHDAKNIGTAIFVATISALAGSALGKHWLPKITVPFFQRMVASFMLIIGILLTTGLI